MKLKLLLFLPLLLLVAWSFYLPTRSSTPVGTQLLRTLPPLPQAIPTLDYFPPTSLAPPPDRLTPTPFPTPEPTMQIDSYRLDSATLVIPRRAPALLRARLASADSAILRTALRKLDYAFDAPDRIVASARQTLLAQTDLALLQEYLRADRFTLAHCSDLDRAAQLALLLLSTPITDATATFQIRGHTYYLLTTRDDLEARPATTTVVCLAPDGSELFHGVLSFDDPSPSHPATPQDAFLPTLYRLAQCLTPPSRVPHD